MSEPMPSIPTQSTFTYPNPNLSASPSDPAGIDSADSVSAVSDSAGGNPAGSFQPAASYEPAGQGNPAVSTSVSADFSPVHADESTLPPGQSLGSSENNTRFPVPSDVCKDQLSSGIFTSSSYDDDFSATLTNLAPAVEVNPVPTKRVNTIHPQSQILGDLASPVLTRSRAQKSKFGESAFIGYVQDQQRINHTDQLHCLFACFLSQLEPTSIAKALKDPDWVAAMQEEMQQFINQKVWKLVPLPHGKHAIGTKWILKNKRDARGIVVRNKARLVAQGHRQEEGIDYDEVFAPVARIEAIRLFLAFASYMGFLVYQMDVKSAFLYGEIEEEVYVTQPKGFEDPYFPKHVYRVVKALYGLHQAPRAWYERLSAFLLQHNYRRGTIDKTLFIKKDSRDILLVQVYVDDIIFGSTNKAWCEEFEVLMQGEFEMSAMGEMSFFLGLQVKQLPDGIFISQDKYVKDMLTKFDMESVRTATTPYEAAKTKLKDESDPPVNVHLYRSMIGSLMYLTASRPDIMFAVSACSRHQVTPLTSHLNAVKKIFKYLKGQPKLGLWYPKDSPFQLEAYSDSDYAGSHGDRKSTTGGCQFLGRRLISWQCKKQTIVATSSTEAEYVAAASCCAQVLWIQNQLLDYGFNFMNTKIFIDNQSTICIVKNPVFHQRTKHIEIRHHFIRDANEKNLIQVLKIHTDDNVADLLTKAFDGPRFEYLVVHIGMVDMVLVSADSTMILLGVILPAGCLVSAVVYAVNTSFYAAELVCAGSIMFLLAELFLLVVTCLCCLNLVSAVLSLILLVGWSLPLVTQFLLVVSIPAGVSIGINEFFLDSDKDEQIGVSRFSSLVLWLVDKLPDDEIVDPRVSSESESDDDLENYIPPLPYGAFKDWEIVRCPLSTTYYHVYYQENRRQKSFFYLKQLLPHVYREDLLLLRRRMNRYFRLNPDVDVGLDLWRDVLSLCQSLNFDDVEDFLEKHKMNGCELLELYPKSSVMLGLNAWDNVYMFVKSSILSGYTAERMLRHRLTVPPSYCRDVVVAGNVIQTVQAGLRESYECLASAPLLEVCCLEMLLPHLILLFIEFMLFPLMLLWLLQFLLLVVLLLVTLYPLVYADAAYFVPAAPQSSYFEKIYSRNLGINGVKPSLGEDFQVASADYVSDWVMFQVYADRDRICDLLIIGRRNDGVAASFQQSQFHYHMLIFKIE
ncbi:putative ribonuclease H-like domain-containing protein [Tanacetum coccineum]